MLSDRAVAAKFGPLEAQITAAQKNIDLFMKSPNYTVAEKNQALKVQAQLEDRKAAIANQILEQKEVFTAYKDAVGNIANFKPTAQYPTANDALNAMNKSHTGMEAFQIAASVGMTTKAVAPKIFGNTKTGYYAYDSNGNVLPLVGGGGTGTGGGGTGGGTSGGVPTSEVTQGKAALQASKFAGAEADGKYADPNLYLKYYQGWRGSGGTPESFFKAFPPATYINPANKSLPPEIMKFVKTTTTGFH
jgi:hypothetical protein